MDRTKQDIDVMERVFRGVRTGTGEEIRGHLETQHARWRLWLGVNSGASTRHTDDDEADDR